MRIDFAKDAENELENVPVVVVVASLFIFHYRLSTATPTSSPLRHRINAAHNFRSIIAHYSKFAKNHSVGVTIHTCLL